MTASSRHFLLSSVTKLVKMRKWPRPLLRCRIHQKLEFRSEAHLYTLDANSSLGVYSSRYAVAKRSWSSYPRLSHQASASRVDSFTVEAVRLTKNSSSSTRVGSSRFEHLTIAIVRPCHGS